MTPEERKDKPWIIGAFAVAGMLTFVVMIYRVHKGPVSKPSMLEMKVKELIQALQQLPDQDATVVISHEAGLDVFLVITGIVQRNIRRLELPRQHAQSEAGARRMLRATIMG
jgi:hypothetical protein